jgi:uncharacterized protein YoxC
VTVAASAALTALWIALSTFLVAVGIALTILLVRLSGTAGRLSRLLQGLESSVVPLLTKTGGTVDRVNLQLDKVDLVTDSAVSAADSLDTAVRAVSVAVTRPVQKVSALAKGVSHGTSALVATKDFRAAVDAGKDAARRREREIAEELARHDRRLQLPGKPPSAETPPAAATPAAGSPIPSPPGPPPAGPPAPGPPAPEPPGAGPPDSSSTRETATRETIVEDRAT